MRIRRFFLTSVAAPPMAMARAARPGTIASLLLVSALLGACGRGDAGASGAPPSAAATGSSDTPPKVAGAAAPAPAIFPRTLQDSTGASITLAAPPRRIVSQTLGTDEILFVICPRDRLVAVSPFAANAEYSNIAVEAAASGLPAVNGAEDIIRLTPDLIFVASYSRAETVDLLRASHAPIFKFASFDRIDDVLANIRTMGQAIGEEGKAEALIAGARRRLDEARARIPADRKPRVMSLSSYGTTAAGATLFDDIIRHAGAINVPAEKGLTGFPQVSAEQVLAWQPDFIIFDAAPGREDEARRRFKTDPAFAATRAVREGRLVLMPGRQFLTVSHHVVDAVDTLVQALYGASPDAPASSASPAASTPSSSATTSQPAAHPTGTPTPTSGRTP